MKRFVILGAGTGGTIMANRLRRRYGEEIRRGEYHLTIVDNDPHHLYQPGLLFIPFGLYTPDDISKPRRVFVPPDVEYIASTIDRVSPESNTVTLENGKTLEYDVLIIATGARLVPEETEGLTGPGWRETMFDFYSLEGSTALGKKLVEWEGGRLVLNIVDMPIKCPPAPLEFVFLADWFFRQRKMRDRVTITFVTPLDVAFTKPLAAKMLSHVMRDKDIELITEFNTGEVDGTAGRLTSYDDRTVDFDLLVTVPLHSGAEYVGRSPGLGDDLDFVLTDPATLQARCQPNIFALGDATDLPASKAGSVVHFEAELLEENLDRFLRGQALEPSFDGHANCFIESGHHKAYLIDFNYDTEPLPGRFPLPGVGPMSLMKATRINHLGKLAFRWIYWHLLLPGRRLPTVTARMSMRGKHRPRPEAEPVGAPTP